MTTQIGNASASFSSLGATLRLSVNVCDLSVDDRRSLLNALLLDPQTCPGHVKLSHEDRLNALAWLNKWCGWPKAEHAAGGRG